MRSALRRRLLAIPPRAVSFDVLGFAPATPRCADAWRRCWRPSSTATTCRSRSMILPSWRTRSAASSTTHHVGFAFEGVGLSYALRDLLAPWRQPAEPAARLPRGPGRDHDYIVAVGAGFAVARLPWGAGSGRPTPGGWTRSSPGACPTATASTKASFILRATIAGRAEPPAAAPPLRAPALRFRARAQPVVEPGRGAAAHRARDRRLRPGAAAGDVVRHRRRRGLRRRRRRLGRRAARAAPTSPAPAAPTSSPASRSPPACARRAATLAGTDRACELLLGRSADEAGDWLAATADASSRTRASDARDPAP